MAAAGAACGTAPVVAGRQFTTRAKLEFVRKYWLGLLVRKIRYRRR